MTVTRIALAKPKNPQFWNRCGVNVCIRMCLFWMPRYIETGSLSRRTLINLNVIRRWLDTLSFWLTIYLQYKWQWNKSLLFAKCNFIFYVWHWFHVDIFSALGMHSEPQTHVGYRTTVASFIFILESEIFRRKFENSLHTLWLRIKHLSKVFSIFCVNLIWIIRFAQQIPHTLHWCGNSANVFAFGFNRRISI